MQKTYLFRHPENISPLQLELELLPRLPEWRKKQALQYRQHLSRVLCAKAFLILQEGLVSDFNFKEDIIFDYLEHQKPIISKHPELHFNLSHCKTGILCVIDDTGPVGCDIEPTARKITNSLIELCCNEKERLSIAKATDPHLEFLKFWTIKEAVLKQLGCGLVHNLPHLLTPSLLTNVTLSTYVEESFVYTICSQQIR